MVPWVLNRQFHALLLRVATFIGFFRGYFQPSARLICLHCMLCVFYMYVHVHVHVHGHVHNGVPGYISSMNPPPPPPMCTF